MTRPIAAQTMVFWLLGVGILATAQTIQVPGRSALWRGALDRDVEFLRESIATAQRELDSLERNVVTLRREIDDLIEKATSMPAQPDQSESDDESGVEELKYRPPLARRSGLATVCFVCLEGNVIYSDFGALNQREREVEQSPDFVQQLQQNSRGTEQVRKSFSVPRGNFDLQYVYHVNEDDVIVMERLEAVPKAGRLGEPVSQLRLEGSEFLAALTKVDPRSTAIQFYVYHDSFQAFRAARAIAWERGFEVGWFPFTSGGKLVLSAGGGVQL